MNTAFIHQKAYDVAGRVTPDKAQIDPFTIIAIAELIIEVIKLIKECRDKHPHQVISRPSVISRWQLKRLVSRYGLQPNINGAMLAVGKDMTGEEVDQLMASI